MSKINDTPHVSSGLIFWSSACLVSLFGIRGFFFPVIRISDISRWVGATFGMGFPGGLDGKEPT